MWLQDIEKGIAKIREKFGGEILIKDISPAYDSAIVFHTTNQMTIKYWYNTDEISMWDTDDWRTGKCHIKF